MLGQPTVQDFVATRYHGARVTVSDSFVTAAAMHDRIFEVDREGFQALVVRAHDLHDAAHVLRHADFDDSWWHTVEVDAQRPLTCWVEGVRWAETDDSALRAAQREVMSERKLEFERRTRLTSAELAV